MEASGSLCVVPMTAAQHHLGICDKCHAQALTQMLRQKFGIHFVIRILTISLHEVGTLSGLGIPGLSNIGSFPLGSLIITN